MPQQRENEAGALGVGQMERHICGGRGWECSRQQLHTNGGFSGRRDGIERTGWQEKTHGDRHDFLLKSQPLMHLSKDKKAGQAPPLKAGNWFCLFCRRLVVRLLAAIL